MALAVIGISEMVAFKSQIPKHDNIGHSLLCVCPLELPEEFTDKQINFKLPCKYGIK